MNGSLWLSPAAWSLLDMQGQQTGRQTWVSTPDISLTQNNVVNQAEFEATSLFFCFVSLCFHHHYQGGTWRR